MSDVLRSAVHELYESQLAALLTTYRHLAYVAEEGTYRAFYLAVAAELHVERLRRQAAWTAIVADLLDDGTSGEMVG
jgi:alkyl sulfatase BDS1-like metallo-beta-lactamase superfamily hydrolase